MYRGQLLPVLAVTLLAVLLAACTQGTSDTAPPSSTSSSDEERSDAARPGGDAVFAILKNGQLVAAVPDRSHLVGQIRVTESPLARSGFPLLAADQSRRRLYVLTPLTHQRDAIVVVNPTRLTVVARWQLPRNVSYRAVVVGSDTGRLYLFGNRRDGRAEMGPGEDALITVLSPSTGDVLQTWTVRRAAGHDWFVYAGAVSAGAHQLVVSYHGPDTTGIDVISLNGAKHTRCRPKTPRSAGTACLATHGDFTVYHGQIFATTGFPDRLLKLTLTGKVLHTYRTKLPGNHLMEFAADLDHHLLWPIGPCGYAGGISVIDVVRDKTRVLMPPGQTKDNVCGSRVRFLRGDQDLVVAANPAPAPTGDSAPSSLIFINAENASSRQRVQLPAPVEDLLTVSPAPSPLRTK